MFWIEQVTPVTMAERFRVILDAAAAREAMLERARRLVTDGGATAAAQRVLSIVAARRAVGRGQPARAGAAADGR